MIGAEWFQKQLESIKRKYSFAVTEVDLKNKNIYMNF